MHHPFEGLYLLSQKEDYGNQPCQQRQHNLVHRSGKPSPVNRPQNVLQGQPGCKETSSYKEALPEFPFMTIPFHCQNM